MTMDVNDVKWDLSKLYKGPEAAELAEDIEYVKNIHKGFPENLREGLMNFQPKNSLSFLLMLRNLRNHRKNDDVRLSFLPRIPLTPKRTSFSPRFRMLLQKLRTTLFL